MAPNHSQGKVHAPNLNRPIPTQISPNLRYFVFSGGKQCEVVSVDPYYGPGTVISIVDASIH